MNIKMPKNKIDRIILDIINSKDLDLHGEFYAIQLRDLAQNYRKLQLQLNKELNASLIDQKEVSTIIKNMVALNGLITDRLNYFDVEDEDVLVFNEQ